MSDTPDLTARLLAIVEYKRVWDRDPSGTLDGLAALFYAETGFIAPGKSVPLEMAATQDDAERQLAWTAWLRALSDARDAVVLQAAAEIISLRAQIHEARAELVKPVRTGCDDCLEARRAAEARADAAEAETAHARRLSLEHALSSIGLMEALRAALDGQPLTGAQQAYALAREVAAEKARADAAAQAMTDLNSYAGREAARADTAELDRDIAQRALTAAHEGTARLRESLIAAAAAHLLTIDERDTAIRLAREATNGWACGVRTKRALDDISRLHKAIDALAAPPVASQGVVGGPDDGEVSRASLAPVASQAPPRETER